MSYKFPNSSVLLFTKEPIIGKVKTRLHKSIGRQRALDLHCAMLTYQINKIRVSKLAPLELWVNGDPAGVRLSEIAQDCTIYKQVGRDLGRRMLYAAEAALTRASTVILLGTDCPSVEVKYLEDTLQLMQNGKQVVVGPAEDGGYVMLGLTGNWPQLFDNIPWGTDRVLAITRERIESQALDYSLLTPRWDVDRPEDLQRLTTLQPPIEILEIP